MRRSRPSTIAAVVLVVGLSLVGSTSYAHYLSSIGPANCCRDHCHRGQPMSGADAERCCSTHLSVLPSALGTSATDMQHALASVGSATLLVSAAPWLDARTLPSQAVRLRGSPPGSLVAAHTALLI